jgi:arsenite methyltransferase
VSTSEQRDHWASWFAERRHGGDPEELRQTLEHLTPVRDTVLANAGISEGSRVLDIGCGDGLIALPAADIVGASGEVIFSDISGDLLDRCRELAADAGLLDRCRFVRVPARDLQPIDDQTVDAVTLRSVLIYETDKADAFAEFRRVLRPGGRLSLFEPINRFAYPEPTDRFGGFDISPVIDLFTRIKAIYQAIQPESDPMLDFDERDLVALANDAGFDEVHLQLQIDVGRSDPYKPRSWQTFVNSSGNPRIPTLAEAIDQALAPDEARRLTEHLQPLVEQGRGQQRSAVAYLRAIR